MSWIAISSTYFDHMRVVIDSNRLQSDELANFLANSPSNRAVVTDWIMMEAYKGDTLNSIYKSLKVLARFPRQVVVLKNTGMCMQARSGSQMANRLIWQEHTNSFPQFMKDVESARMGDILIAQSLVDRGAIANARMQQLLAQTEQIIVAQSGMMDALTHQDIKAIRGAGVAPPDLLVRIKWIASQVSEGFRLLLEDKAPSIDRHRPTDSFLWRVGVAFVSWFIEWVRTGSQIATKPEKVRNDYVDAMLAVYGSYFNGLMTADSKLSKIHQVNRHLIQMLGARTPPAYESSIL